ncbi:MEP1B [Branchiostoma lanceolatum]|uniref:Metalloendopeptidase n=1 Tax=Branchiostoma lanceolatum TaxID=7740 RepID=A0A8J9ZKZ1_BRALA|nr:MEP1B [Branchiostoma lanceolatum]
MYALPVSAVLLVFGAGLAASVPADSIRTSPEPETATKAILNANKGLNLYQGDIDGPDPNSRNAIHDATRWPNGVIPYVIGGEFSQSCFDTDGSCGGWASAGECTNNPGFMQSYCPQSCGLCRRAVRSCADSNEYCSSWASAGECTNNPAYMNANCQLSCGVCSTGGGGGACADSHESCGYWASVGECTNSPAYMNQNCMLSCNLCGNTGGNNNNNNGGTTQTSSAGSEVGRIQAAMEEFNRRTCIRFVPRTNEQNYIHIRKSTGCHAYVGVQGGAQEVSLGDGCLGKATIMHELMHAAGFWHEHSRPDRDDWVYIHLENVPQAQWHAFDKHSESRTLGLPYDYGSIVHYESHAFSMNGMQVIVPRHSTNGIVLGAAQDFSSLDLQKLNALYNCYAGK